MFNIGFNGRQRVFVNQIRFIEDNDVRKFDLLCQKISNSANVLFGCRLIDALEILADSKVLQKVGCINHRDHRVQLGNVRQRSVVADSESKRIGHRRRFRNPGRLNQQVVKATFHR